MQLQQYSNELKVGAAIVLAVFAAFAGIRFFQDVPLFGSSYTMYAEFDSAGGLVSGNPVRLKGVKVGSVEGVQLDTETQKVRVRLQLEQDTRIPKGSTAQVAGISALGGVHLQINPGPRENPPLTAGAVLQPPPEGTVFDRLTDRAPVLASKADSVLTNTNATMAQLSQELRSPESDLRRTLVSLRGLSGDLEEITATEKENIRQLVQNLEGVSGNLESLTSDDSLGVTVRRLNQSLDRLNRSLASFEKTSATLDTITTKLNRGDGTAGRLVNDPGLYLKMDSAAARTNRILEDFQQNPGRYLDDMTLVKMF
jgi:phospholipid/cholesterol/gamma-HCH transport system substrate-binding protein